MGKNYLQNIQGILRKFSKMLNAPNKFSLHGRRKKGEGRGGEGMGERGKREMGKGKGAFPFSSLPNPLSLFRPFLSPLDACHVSQRGCVHTRLGFCCPFLLGVYCLYRRFVTDNLITSVRKFESNILQVLIFVIAGEKWRKVCF